MGKNFPLGNAGSSVSFVRGGHSIKVTDMFYNFCSFLEQFSDVCGSNARLNAQDAFAMQLHWVMSQLAKTVCLFQ